MVLALKFLGRSTLALVRGLLVILARGLSAILVQALAQGARILARLVQTSTSCKMHPGGAFARASGCAAPRKGCGPRGRLRASRFT